MFKCKVRMCIFTLLLLVGCCFAQKGSILSWANTGEGQVWGLDSREMPTGLELHLMAADGQVYQLGVTGLADIVNGTEGGLDFKSAMMDPNGVSGNMRGLALVPTYEGAYGQMYICTQDNVSKYRAVWGEPADIGSMTWTGIDGAWTTNAFGTDITPVSRSYATMDDWDIWTVNSTDLGSGAENAIYRYSNIPWILDKSMYLEKFVMPKPLQAVALGDTDELWVLCTDGEILNVSSVDGSVIDRFFIDPTITTAWGLAYMPSKQTLWLTNQADSNIYQIATRDDQYKPSVSFAPKGSILSWANAGEGQVWGLDSREMPGSLELHLMAADGQVYQLGVTSLGNIANGSEGGLDFKNAMMDSANVSGNMRGLALVPTYEGVYGQMYICTQDNVAKYRAVWGEPADVGSMTWTGIDGAWTTYAFGTDITPVSRTYATIDDWDIWTVNSTDLGSGAENAIYRYTNIPWIVDKEMYLEKFVMPKPLQAVALGDTDELWVLCTDGEILNVSSVDGSILDRFYIDSSITAAWGLAYMPSKQTLWLTNQADLNIYQIATRDDQFKPLMADVSGDQAVDMEDFAMLASDWMLSEDFIQQKQSLGLLNIAGTSPTDGVYDWGGSTILDNDGKYKMWWTRGDPYDTIWCAESSDGLNWDNAQKVLSALDAGTQEQMHVAHPSVVKVGTTYYMLYEAPNADGQGQIFLATSTNGISWNRYPNNTDPQPVIALPAGTAEGAYGIGMPSVIYKDGNFEMFYMSNLTGWPDQTRLAVTSDPTNWGAVSSHNIACAGAAGLGVAWNSVLNKYVALYTADVGVDRTDTISCYIFTSPDGYNWSNGDGGVYNQPYLWTISIALNNITTTGFDNPRTRGFAHFCSTDTYGTVNTATMSFNFMEGDMFEAGQDWKQYANTWNLYAGTVKLNDETGFVLESDLNGDGIVDESDLSIMASEWLMQIPVF